MPFDSAHNSYKYCFAYGNTTNSEGKILEGCYFFEVYIYLGLP